MNMEITTACQVKASFNDDIRRFSVLRDASFNQLKDNVVQIFSIDPNAQVVLKYTDNEGEHVTMSSDVELREAMNISPTILRVVVSVKPAAAPFAPSASAVPFVEVIEDISLRNAPAGAEQPMGLYPRWWGQKGQDASPFSPSGFRPFFGNSFPQGMNAHGPHPHPPFHGQGPHPFGGPHGHPHHPPHHGFRQGPMMQQTPGAPFPPFAFGEPHFKHHARHHHQKGMRDEQMRMWKEQKREWKKQWHTMSKEDREKMQDQKKEMKKQWKAHKMALFEQQRGMKGKLIARHVKDVTMTDGTELAPGASFVKTWRIRNEGEAWPAGCRLLWISRHGDRMGAPESVLIPVEGPVAPQQEVDVSVDLVAPTEPGRYTCYFRMATAEGVKFGQRMWASIVVAGSSSSSSDQEVAMLKYGNVAEMIESMGFSTKRKHIIRLLEKHDGDVDKVVRVLAKKDKGCKEYKKNKGHTKYC